MAPMSVPHMGPSHQDSVVVLSVTPLGAVQQSTFKNTSTMAPSFDGYSIYVDDHDGSSGTKAKRISCTEVVGLFGSWYSSQLDHHPVRTKCITAAILAATGDVLAQLIEHHTNLRLGTTGDLDERRIIAMFIEGLCFSGPLLHFVFEFYEYIFPIHCLERPLDGCDPSENEIEIQKDDDTHLESNHHIVHQDYMMSQRRCLNAFLHVAFDQVVMAFPYVGGLMIITSLVEGHGDELAEELENEYIPNVKASWMAALGLAPFQILAFRFLPVTWRVLAVNLQDVLWVMIMSYVTHRTREPSEPIMGDE